MNDVMELTREQATTEQDEPTRLTDLPWPIRRERLRQKLEQARRDEVDEGDVTTG